MRRFLTSFCVTLALLAVTPPAYADIDGAQDHTITGRYDGSEITGYKAVEFDVYGVHDATGLTTLEGAVTEIAYALPSGTTIVGAERNFAKRLTDQGYTPVYACNTASSAERCNRDIAYHVGQLPIPAMMIDSFAFAYQLFQSPAPGNIHVAILTSRNNDRVFLQASIIEADDLAFNMIDATQIQDTLTTEGQIALYGIQFDTDSADIKPESRDTLAALGQYLTDQPVMEILIVGHTDNQGSMAYNMDLSTRRAAAVRSYLGVNHGIAPDRLQAAGVGYLAPVAPNTTAEGRALNRRVVIVPQ